MHTVFTVISLLVTLVTGGFVADGAGGPEADPWGRTSVSFTADDDADRGPAADPWGNSSNSQADDSEDRGPSPDPWG